MKKGYLVVKANSLFEAWLGIVDKKIISAELMDYVFENIETKYDCRLDKEKDGVKYYQSNKTNKWFAIDIKTLYVYNSQKQKFVAS